MAQALEADAPPAFGVDDEEVVIPPQPTWREQMVDSFRPANLISSLIAGSVTGIIGVTGVVAFASLLYSGQLAPYAAAGMGMFLFGSMVISALAALFSSTSGVVAGVQDAGVAVLGVIAVALAATMPPGTAPHDLFVLVVAAVTASGALTGLIFMTLGFFKLGNLIRFIPYPVIGGFLSGSGLLLVRGALSVMTGADPLKALVTPALMAHWLPGLAFAVILLIAMRRINHFLVVPSMLVGSIGVFFLVLALTRTPVDAASSQGWLVSGVPQGGLWNPVPFAELIAVDWLRVLSQASSLLSVAMVLTIALLLNASGIELEVQREVNLNHELMTLGAANLFAALGGSAPGGHYLGSTGLVNRMKAGTRLTGVVQAAICAIVLFAGGSLLSYFPKFVLGGLLMFFGFSFIIRWAIDSRTELPTQDYIVVLLILGAIFVLGFLPGVALGVALAVVLFVVNYSRINVIKHQLSGANHQSTVERPDLYRKLLQGKGHWLYMLKLQGFIFFGTANTLFNQFKDRVLDPELQKPRYFLLDFQQVTGVDSSAMLSFRKMLQFAEQYRIMLIFTALPRSMKAQLEKPPFAALRGARWAWFEDMDHGMEWYEDKVIEDFESVGFGIKPPTMTRQLQKLLSDRKAVATMMTYFEHRDVEAGTVLLEQGDPPGGIYFIEEGRMRVELDLHETKAIRLRTMSSGTVFGELGTYLNIPATASVIAEKETDLFFLSTASLRQMEEKNPEIAAVFHRFMAHTLAERLASAADALKVALG